MHQEWTTSIGWYKLHLQTHCTADLRTATFFVDDSYNCLVDRNIQDQHEPEVDPQVVYQYYCERLSLHAKLFFTTIAQQIITKEQLLLWLLLWLWLVLFNSFHAMAVI
jgi:hypothetical protein